MSQPPVEIPLPADADKVFVLTDSNVAPLCADILPHACRIVTPAGEENKNLDAVAAIWAALSNSGATRRSVTVNIGGGMISDMGGFAAATFKRGIRYINVPTTILAAVDASIGGKTGIDMFGLKNEIGAFAMPHAVCPAYHLFRFLPENEWISGYGEILKTALLAGPDQWAEALDTDCLRSDPAALRDIIEACADYKRLIVEQDPGEKGLRKVLNLGHTAGHAFESLCLAKGMPAAHGKAVAHGLLVTLIISRMRGMEVSKCLYSMCSLVREVIGRLPIGCADHDRIVEIMGHDKKNLIAGQPSFVLLRSPGNPVADCTVTPDELNAALDIYCDMNS